jgi:hypothetical protein
VNPGHDLCGRFRLRQVVQTRADRVVWTANDLVTKRIVQVHVGATSLLGEVPTLQRLQGRGVLSFVGLWRDGTDVALVFAHRLPHIRLSDCDKTNALRCVHWLNDLAAAMSRLQVARIVLGNVDASRIWVSGDSAWLDPTGPYVAGCTVRADLTAVGQVIAAVADSQDAQRGPRGLMQSIGHSDPDCRPATALGMRRLTGRALRVPKRRVGPARQVAFAPRRSHQLLVRRLNDEWIRVGVPVSGWGRLTRQKRARMAPANTRWQRVALGWTDLIFVGLLGLLAAVVMPCVGGPIALFVGMRWRRARCRPGAGDFVEGVEWGSDEAVASLALAVEAELPPLTDAGSGSDKEAGA